MKHYQLIQGEDGQFRTPCCGIHLKPPFTYPVHCQCPTKSKGLGDSIAKMTKAVGLPPCDGCNRRRERLNKIFPYRQ